MHDGFRSPDRLLASFFSREIETPGLILVTGPSGSGKTTWCLELIQQARRQGIPPCGFVSPACFENGIKIGIDLVEIHTGERRRLAWPRPEETTAPVAGLSTGAWQFDAATLQWANRSLAKLPPGRLLIIDELGPLELRTNRGLTSGLKLVDERKYLLSLVVIRPALLAAARERWPWGEPLDASRLGAGRKGNPS